MAIVIRSSKKIAEKEISFRNSLWGDAAELIWDRSTAKGFASIPKTFPIVTRIMDELAGHPVSPTYLTLWCQTWDNGFAKISNVKDLAYATGFTGQRGERTFRERVRELERLGFVKSSPNGSEPLGYILVVNPHAVILNHWKLKTVGLREASYNALISRAHDIGCKDVLALLAPPKKSAVTPPAAKSSSHAKLSKPPIRKTKADSHR